MDPEYRTLRRPASYPGRCAWQSEPQRPGPQIAAGGGGRNPKIDFCGQKRSTQIHLSSTDQESRRQFGIVDPLAGGQTFSRGSWLASQSWCKARGAVGSPGSCHFQEAPDARVNTSIPQ